MGFLSFVRDERIVAVGLGVATAASLIAMCVILEHYRDEAEIKPTQPKTQYITQDTEDSLQIGTLQSLLNHYNFAIRDTALKIVAGRAVNDGSVIDDLLWGITREDYEERMKCLRTLAFAVEDKETLQDPLSVLNTPKGYSAIVRSLEICLDDTEHATLDDPLYDEYYLRDIGERRCLLLAHQLIHKYDVDKLIEAKFIDKWLAKQPWGDTEKERRNNFAMYMNRRKNRIRDICLCLQATKAGRKALVKAKLITKTKRPKWDRSDHIQVVLEFSMGSDGDGDGIQLRNTELVPRVNEQSVEEQRLRRRHREAMVLNDGTHSLGRGDIIEREHDSNG
ncbi:Uu.00g046560.m01.CDS01 [Anthostomella pinea]|uniref:Uu.00g046560.m01.CDS01 n=1 Tax=Anthostomella pinea TaxID=933095 RepID=A0AAI8V6B9_9PEZI|nr:Uu.00g046560.m01.CDS01 [Anthostomella pinea]